MVRICRLLRLLLFRLLSLELVAAPAWCDANPLVEVLGAPEIRQTCLVMCLVAVEDSSSVATPEARDLHPVHFALAKEPPGNWACSTAALVAGAH